MNKPYFIMMVGIGGSGKTFIANQTKISGYETVIYNSGDTIQELQRKIKSDLSCGKCVIYDAANINEGQRRNFLESLNKIDCIKHCICVLAPYEICINRAKNTPAEEIKEMYLSWNPPFYDEGFDQIEVVYNFNEKEVDYSIETFVKKTVGLEQGNSHHSLTVGNHCLKAMNYIRENFPNTPILHYAALLHDCGKPFTRSELNYKGENDGDIHYYNHQYCGAYDSLIYLRNILPVSNRLYVANLISNHMKPYMDWKGDSKSKNKFKLNRSFMYCDIMRLHEADLQAR